MVRALPVIRPEIASELAESVFDTAKFPQTVPLPPTSRFFENIFPATHPLKEPPLPTN